jgi:hypothetical protein
MSRQGHTSSRRPVEEPPVSAVPPGHVPVERRLWQEEMIQADDRHGFTRGFRYAILIELIVALIIFGIWMLVHRLW